MPNYCWNTLKMDGIGVKYGSEPFSFQSIVPMQESLNVEAGSRRDISILYFLSKRFTITFDEMSDEDKEIVIRYASRFKNCSYSQITDKYQNIYSQKDYDELYELGEKYVYNIKTTAYTDWYEWRYDNWGTKWDAFEIDIYDKDAISFTTAWCPPVNVIQKLSEQEKDKIVTCIWEEEGGYEGWFCYLNGRCLQDIDRVRPFYDEEDEDYEHDDTSLFDEADTFVESIKRCKDCAYLVEGDPSEWLCDDCGKVVSTIPDSECSAKQKW